MKPSLKSMLFAAPILSGCGYSTKGYRYQGESLAPREANCTLEIFTTRPKAANREVGFVEFKSRRLGRLPTSEIEAREGAHPYACLAGGDGLLIQPDRDGQYTKATILKVRR